MSLPFFTVAFLTPILGAYVDKYGNRVFMIMIACIIGILSHVMLLKLQSAVPLILLGISYSMFGASTWTTVPYIVSKKYTGIAFGIMTSI
jgi:MFS-type transporter involved in bile tolerance (Atg22 family)